MKRLNRSGEPRTPPTIPVLPEKATYRKGAIVDRIADDTTGRASVVRLDKGSMTFYAELGEGETYTSAESKDGRAVADWLRAHLARTEKAERLTWLPVIEINDSSREDGRYSSGRRAVELRARCSVEIGRYYLALTHDKAQWKKLSWEQCDPDSPARLTDDELFGASADFRPGPKAADGTRREAFTIPHFKGGHNYYGDEIIVAYTPELWAGFRAVVAAIEGSRVQLSTMLKSKNGIATIEAAGVAGGVLALTDGKKR